MLKTLFVTRRFEELGGLTHGRALATIAFQRQPWLRGHTLCDTIKITSGTLPTKLKKVWCQRCHLTVETDLHVIQCPTNKNAISRWHNQIRRNWKKAHLEAEVYLEHTYQFDQERLIQILPSFITGKPNSSTWPFLTNATKTFFSFEKPSRRKSTEFWLLRMFQKFRTEQ